jgi:hypothetical protein
MPIPVVGRHVVIPVSLPESGHPTHAWCARVGWRRIVQAGNNFVGDRWGILLSIQRVGYAHALGIVNS